MIQRIEKKSKVESRKSKVGTSLFYLLLFILLWPNVVCGATKLLLKNTISPLTEGACSPSFSCRRASTTQGSSVAGVTTSSIAGPLTGHYWPITTTNYIVTDSAGGNKNVWFSPPLSAAVTISGTITPNIWGLESNAACNCGFRYEVLRWSKAEGGIVSSLGISTNDGVAEWGTTTSVRTSPTLTPTSTAFAVGDRIVMVFYNDDANGYTEGSGRTWQLRFDNVTGGDGDTYLSFTETITFSADSNNARPLAVTSRVRQLTDSPLLPFYFDQWRIRQPIRQLTDQRTDSEPGNRR
jgi:hypothetical protein